MKFFEKYGMSKTIQFFVGVLFLLLIVILGATLWPEAKRAGLMYRLFVGLGIGYALSRAAMGFAGTVNRAYTTGSGKLMRAIATLFIFGGLATFIVTLSGHMTVADLSTNGINWGLLIGATMFGFGMAFSVCCASGVLTDLAESPLRALIVLFFFCMGGFLGKALVNQDWMAWYKEGLFGIGALKDGVSFTSWFSWDGTGGVLGALILTIILASVVIYLASLYERKRIANNTYIGCGCEKCYEEIKKNNGANETLAYKIIAKPWSMTVGAAVLAVCFAALLLSGSKGWGVSGPLGQWFARMLVAFGANQQSIMDMTGYGAGTFTTPFFENAMYVQDTAIFAGALIYLLTSGKFFNPKSWLFKPLEIVFYAFGGILLGLAINLAGGCNAGGLFTPIAEFSLSGWIYLLCIVGGGILGNMTRKALYKVCRLS